MNTHLFFDRALACQVRRLLPGEFAASFPAPEGAVMMTVLGSCVAVCLDDRQARISGMNHFMLPEPMTSRDLARAGVDADNGSARYGSHAMELLINQMLSMGAQRTRLQARVYGGAQILAHRSDIGESNVRFALAYLKRERIRMQAGDTGGRLARKLYLDPATGIPVCVPISRSLSTVQGREARYALSLKQGVACDSGRISLFAEAP